MTYTKKIQAARVKSGKAAVQYCKDNNLIIEEEQVARDCTCGSGLPWNLCNGLAGTGWSYCG